MSPPSPTPLSPSTCDPHTGTRWARFCTLSLPAKPHSRPRSPNPQADQTPAPAQRPFFSALARVLVSKTLWPTPVLHLHTRLSLAFPPSSQHPSAALSSLAPSPSPSAAPHCLQLLFIGPPAPAVAAPRRTWESGVRGQRSCSAAVRVGPWRPPAAPLRVP